MKTASVQLLPKKKGRGVEASEKGLKRAWEDGGGGGVATKAKRICQLVRPDVCSCFLF